MKYLPFLPPKYRIEEFLNFEQKFKKKNHPKILLPTKCRVGVTPNSKNHLRQIFLYAVKSGHDIKHIGLTSCGSPEMLF